MEILANFEYPGLFVAAFLAATILPLSSELVLTALLLGGFSPPALIAVATAGNVSGSLTNYALGYWASLGTLQKWLRLSDAEFNQSKKRFERFGVWSLLFAWVPVIGDPLTVVAGILRVPLWLFVILVGAGKLIRYIAVSYIVLAA